MTHDFDSKIKFFIDSTQKISEISAALEQLHIYHFSFLERFKNGEVIYFSNNSNWIRDYYTKELFTSSQFDKDTPEFQNFEFVLWPDDSPLEVYRYARDVYDSDHGITLIKTLSHSRRYFFFSTRKDLVIVKQFYVNHLDVLKRFVNFFEQEAHSHIQKAHTLLKIDQKKMGAPLSLKTKREDHDKELKQFYQNTPIQLTKTLTLPSFDFIKLSPQEWRCFRMIAKHYTTREMSDELQLSMRTVETHLNNLKNKFSCFRKTELFELAIRFKYLFD